MTKFRTIILSAVLTLGVPATPAFAADGWGSSWSFGPTTSRIIHAKTTLVPGRLAVVTANTGPLFLWPGMSNPTSDLIQTTMDAWPDNASYCKATAGQWCVEASVFGSFGQRNGPTVAIDPDDHVTIEYVLGSDNNTWTQTVSSMKLGKVVSTLTSTSGEMPLGGFGFATEADADSYTIDTQYYLCSEIHLAAADPHFGATGGGGVGAAHGATGTGSGIGTAKNLRTPDAGLTWLVDLITLPAMQPQGTQTAAPAIDCTYGETGGSGGAGGTGAGGSGAGGAAAGGSGASGHTGTGGASGSQGGTGGSAAGGANNTGGLSSAGANSAGNGSGGLSSGGGLSSAGGAGGNASGGASTSGGGRAGGTSGVSGSASGGASATGTGGSLPGGGSASAGTSSTPATDGDQSSGCSCGIPRRSASEPLLLLFGFLAACGMRRRRR